MQSGYASNAHLGTPVVPELKQMSRQAKSLQNSVAQKVFDATMATPDMSMNERKSVFRVAALGLQGPSLTVEPRGGFSTGNMTHTRIGASVASDGVEASIRQFPTYFTGDAPRKTVGPTTHTTADNPVFREFDGKVRSGIGSMSIARMDDEIRIGNAKREEHRARLLGSTAVVQEEKEKEKENGTVTPIQQVKTAPTPLPVWKRVPVVTPTRVLVAPPPPTPEIETPEALTASSQQHTSLTAVARSSYPEAMSTEVLLASKNEDTQHDFFGVNKQSLFIASAFSAVVLLLIVVIIIQGSQKAHLHG